MYTRIKKSGRWEYLQICESKRNGNKVTQRVITTLGRLDRLQAKGEVEKIVRSLAKYSAPVLLVLSSKSDIKATMFKIGPSLILERLWQETGIKSAIEKLLSARHFSFSVERAIYLTVLHRIFISGSDRNCDRWRRDYRIEGVSELQLHHLYRAMAWLGEPLADQPEGSSVSVRCSKDLIEERLYTSRRDLFTSLDVVFFDTTSLYFEGNGGEMLGQRGHSRDHRPDLNQMVVGVVLDDKGKPLCCELWPGNMADVKALIPVTDRIRTRFGVHQFCVVSDRGMISQATVAELEDERRRLWYILGVRMRLVKQVRELIFAHQDGASYQEVSNPSGHKGSSASLKVKGVMVGARRYILCYNRQQAEKEAQDREAIIAGLRERLQNNPKSLIGNKGYQKYLRLHQDTMELDEEKIKTAALYDGKWVLETNLDWPAAEIALKYKQLWQVEQAFRDLKSILDTRPIFHQTDETIRGHVFCSFLALVLRKELEQQLEQQGYEFEWCDIKQDLQALQETIIEDKGKRFAIRSECQGVCGKVFQAVGVAIPRTIREL